MELPIQKTITIIISPNLRDAKIDARKGENVGKSVGEESSELHTKGVCFLRVRPTVFL